MTPSPAVRHATLLVAAAVAAAVGAAADALPGTTIMSARGIQVSHLAVSCVCGGHSNDTRDMQGTVLYET